MNARPVKNTKKEIRTSMKTTRPPRLEGAVKEAMMQPKKKVKKAVPAVKKYQKPQGPSAIEVKDYQLETRRRK